jgi:Protein of unknown function (DUF2946)
MLAEMQRVRSVFAKILLLAAAAIQPLAFALGLALAVAQTATDASALGPVVICSAHGAVVLPDASDDQHQAPPGHKTPDCPYCTLACQGASLKALLASPAPAWLLPWGRLERIDDRTEDPWVTPRLLRLVTSPPRAPPSLA